MKLSIERASLLRALGHVQSVVEKRNTIPILSNVLLRAADDRLSLVATDMDLEIVESVGANVTAAGATTAPAHTLFEIVRKLPDGSQIDLELIDNGNALSLRAGRSTFRLGCLPVDDFPHMTGGELNHPFTLAAADLKSMIDRTRFAMSAEETRYYLNGIYVHTAKADGIDTLRAVATDGHRLARVEIALPTAATDMPGVIIPRKTVNEIRRLIDESTGQIGLSLSENKIRFAFDDVVLTSKLIDGTYPDYTRVIPSGNDKILAVDTKVFTSAVDRVSTISTEKSRAVKLSLADRTLTLSANSPDSGSASEDIEVQYEGGNIEIGFNARYLLDITSQIDGDGCQLVMADSASPTLIRDPSDPQAIYVLMPMRV
jgi:DNA polymerase-3 subunit beta